MLCITIDKIVFGNSGLDKGWQDNIDAEKSILSIAMPNRWC